MLEISTCKNEMKAAEFFKNLEQKDDMILKEETNRIEKIVKDELAKRLTTEQLDQIEYDEKLKKNYSSRSDNDAKCIICLDNPPKMAFIPCGHKHICKGCKGVFKSKACPVCRTEITGIIEIFEN